jgi:hypothetical protein
MDGTLKRIDDMWHALDNQGVAIMTDGSLDALKLSLAGHYKSLLSCPTVYITFDGDSFCVKQMNYDYDVKKFQWDSNISWMYQSE